MLDGDVKNRRNGKDMFHSSINAREEALFKKKTFEAFSKDLVKEVWND